MLFESTQTVILGVTGSIAAYRACELARLLVHAGIGSVHTVMTPSASQFVSPLSFQALTQQAVYTSELSVTLDGIPSHIALAQQASAMVVAPCSANTLAKLALGLADTMVSTTALCMADKPLLVVPAMNPRMWAHPATQAHVATLRQRPNVTVLEPTTGLLACGETGSGHLPDNATILQALYRLLHPQAGLYLGKRVLISAGGTQEPIDPVRFITNHSSGHMGLALANEAWAMGAQVTLVSANVGHSHMELPYPVITTPRASDMHAALHEQLPHCDYLWMSAAVSDYQLAGTPAEHKLKKQGQALQLTLQTNPDCLKNLGERCKNDPALRHITLIGFCAETQHWLEAARQKLDDKHVHAMVVNDVSRSDIGFSATHNEVSLFCKNQAQPQHFAKASKTIIARQLLQALAANTPLLHTNGLTYA